VAAWLVQHHIDLQIKDMVLNTLTNRCLRNCFSLIQSSCLHPFSCGWDAVLHRQPWPPPMQLVIPANGVQVRPLPWPSFYWRAALVLWIKSLVAAGSIVPKLPWWAFDPCNLCKVVGSCNMSKHVAGNIQSQCYMSGVAYQTMWLLVFFQYISTWRWFPTTLQNELRIINWAWENDCVFNWSAFRIHGAVHSSPDNATDVRPKWHGTVQLFLEKFGDGIFADSNESSSFLIICQDVVDPFQLRRVEALQRMGIEALCPVQEAAWLETIGLGTFERNICINFPTGAGKTLAYVLPIMQALVVLHTRDLAWQVKEAFDVIAPVVDFLVGSAVGKSSIAEEVFSLVRQSKQELYSTIDEEYVQMEPQTKIEILVAISGRLRDHINMTNDFSLKHLHYESFMHQIECSERIFNHG
jgi:hypothetical protein